MSPSVAVVILNWNGRKHLETYLPSVVKNSTKATVYLADNDSTDDSLAFTKDNYPSIKFIINESNGGFAKGYNDALKELKEDYFVLLNSDVEVTPNWIEPVIKQLESLENVCIAQPKIKTYLNKDEFEYAGAAGGFIDFLGYPFCQGRIFDSIERDNGQYDTSREVFWATGACMFIKSSIFNQLDGFDERYFAHMEEIDLCWRAKNLGYSVYYVSESTVYHLGGGTMKNTNPRKTFLNFRNSLMTLYKNDQSNYRFFKIFLRLVLDGVAFFKLLISSGPQHAFAILQAHFSFYKMKKFRSPVENPNSTGILKTSIVWSHYAKRINRFSQLK
tara:strand:- start:12561 stop:13553 length:993 start_codon:yes stop_codon:yes gene_type:complete